jgi:putative OPT family oligopeptide transporter
MNFTSGRAPETPDFKPFVPPEVTQRELTIRAVVIGCVLGIVFAASSVYLGLKVGLTVSASIPVAVLSITLFRWLAKGTGAKPATILENNIVQTTGSAGESIAAGVAFTLPSLLLMGFDMELERILLVGLLGGLIGVLMMIPLRQGLIVKEHGKLTYPEGTACADVLIVGEKGGTSAVTVFLGFFVGLFYTIANLILRLWADVATFATDFWGKLRGATLSFEVSPPMLGVGYIIGPRTASNMMAGGALAFMILVPLVHLFGDGANEIFYPADRLIRDMSPGQIRNNFILYIGAGAVATGGFIALARSIPSIISAFRGGMKDLKQGAGSTAVKRTERDLPISVVLGGSLAIAAAIWLAPMLEINLTSAVLIILFGFFFVTVSSRITGEIGSSSNPISGMTVATLLLTCGLFVLVGWTGVGFKAMALTTAALVCVAASNGGTISQDLKTGFLVGATPRAQQLSILVGVITSAIVIGFTLKQLNQGSTTYKPVDFGAGASLAAQVSPGQTDARADGTAHNVAYLHEDEGPIQRGKYLVDDGGKPLFLVDPGVCGTFPYTFQRLADAPALAAPADAPMELGPDHKQYKRVELAAASGGLDRGEYLVDSEGHAAYRMNKGEKFDAPKAQLFRLIIDGTLGGKLPWGLVLVGMFLAIIMEMVGVSSLPFAVGLYLPISTSAGIFVGGMVRWLVEKRTGKGGTSESEFSPGTLMASGLIAGGAIAGVIQSVIAWKDSERGLQGLDPLFTTSSLVTDPHLAESWWPLLPFLLMALGLYLVGTRKSKSA